MVSLISRGKPQLPEPAEISSSPAAIPLKRGLKMRAFKNLFTNSTLIKILKGLACILSSLYLTAYVSLYTLGSI